MKFNVLNDVKSVILEEFIENFIFVPFRPGLFPEIQKVVPFVGANFELEVGNEGDRGILRSKPKRPKHISQNFVGEQPFFQ